jgi:hypothetical protein
MYPCLKHLHKWKIKDNPNCTSCNIPETTIHALWECEVAQSTWANFKTLFQTYNESSLTIDKNIALYGVKNQHALNTALTIIRRSLILQREEKQTISIENIKTYINSEKAIEFYIATKLRKEPNYTKRWNRFKTEFLQQP